MSLIPTLLIVAASLAALCACSNGGSPQTGPADETAAPAAAPDPKPAYDLANLPDHPVVLMKTTKGDIVIELDNVKAPISTKNFLEYVQSGHYDGTIFHRVISNFMIQGGGFTEELYKNTVTHPKTVRQPIQNESHNGLSNVRGTIAMARTTAPHSATAQFYINVKNNDPLDPKGPDQFGYAVFGKVVEGMDVVDAIKKVPTKKWGPHGDLPVEPVKIITVSPAPGWAPQQAQ